MFKIAKSQPSWNVWLHQSRQLRLHKANTAVTAPILLLCAQHKLNGVAIPPDKSLAKNMLGLEFNIYGYGEGLLRSILRREVGRLVGKRGGGGGKE